MAVHRELYPSKFIESWVEGESVVGKGSEATGITTAPIGLSSNGYSKMCGSFTRTGLRQESVHQKQPHDIFRTWATTTVSFLLWSLSWTRDDVKSIFPRLGELSLSFSGLSPISFGNQGPRVWKKNGEGQNPSCLSSGKLTVREDLGSHVIVFQSQRSSLPWRLRALHASFCFQALWRCWFYFTAGLCTCPVPTPAKVPIPGSNPEPHRKCMG